jgi:hypothetical protein
MEIPLHGEYTDQDIRHGLALMRGRAYQIAGIGVGIVLAFALLPTIMSMLSGKADALAVLSNALPAVLVAAFLGFLMWQVPRSQARKLRQAPLLQGTVSGAATNEALEIRSEPSESKTKWSAFVQHRMSDEMVLLFQNQAAANMVPRGLFASDQDWQQFRQHVQATVPEKAPGQGGILKWRWVLYAVLALIALAFVLCFLLYTP